MKWDVECIMGEKEGGRMPRSRGGMSETFYERKWSGCWHYVHLRFDGDWKFINASAEELQPIVIDCWVCNRIAHVLSHHPNSHQVTMPPTNNIPTRPLIVQHNQLKQQVSRHLPRQKMSSPTLDLSVSDLFRRKLTLTTRTQWATTLCAATLIY